MVQDFVHQQYDWAVQNDELKRTMDKHSIFPILLNGPGRKKDWGLNTKQMIYYPVPSSKLTWQWKIPIFNTKYIFKWWIFRCYVTVPEGNIWLNVLTYHPVNIAVKIFVSITQRHETIFFNQS